MSKVFISKLVNSLDDLRAIVASSETLAQVAESYGYSNNGRYTRIIRQVCKDSNISIEHFRTSSHYATELVDKECPQCSRTFKVRYNRAGIPEKETCSYSCSNKYFAWKQGAKNYKGSLNNTESPMHYRNILFSFLKLNNITPKCVVCNESDVLDVHHIDECKENNEVNNLVCLCPTHHQALHRYNSFVVYEKIGEYLDSIDKLIKCPVS